MTYSLEIGEVHEQQETVALLPLLAEAGYTGMSQEEFWQHVQKSRALGTHILQALANGNPAGSVSLYFQDHPWLGHGCYIKSLVVDEIYRHMSIAENLFAQVEKQLRAHHCQWSSFGRAIHKAAAVRYAGKYDYAPAGLSYKLKQLPADFCLQNEATKITINRITSSQPFDHYLELMGSFHAGLPSPEDPELYLQRSLNSGYTLWQATYKNQVVGLMGGRLNLEGSWEGLLDVIKVADHPAHTAITQMLVKTAVEHFGVQGASCFFFRTPTEDPTLHADLEACGASLGAHTYIKAVTSTR